MARILNTIGLGLGIVGVLILFIYGPPQPQLEPGVALGLEDATPIDSSGRTVADLNEEVAARRQRHERMSKLGLGLVALAFLFQLGATWAPSAPGYQGQESVPNARQEAQGAIESSSSDDKRSEIGAGDSSVTEP